MAEGEITQGYVSPCWGDLVRRVVILGRQRMTINALNLMPTLGRIEGDTLPESRQAIILRLCFSKTGTRTSHYLPTR